MNKYNPTETESDTEKKTVTKGERGRKRKK